MYYFDSAVSSLGLLLNSEVLISLPFISILKHLFVWLWGVIHPTCPIYLHITGCGN